MPKSDEERQVLRYGDQDQDATDTPAAAPEPNARAQTRYGPDKLDLNILDFFMGKKAEKAAAEPVSFATGPSEVGSSPEENAPFPAKEAGKFAREVGIAYGKSWENYVGNRVARITARAGKGGGVSPSALFDESAMKREYTDQLGDAVLDPKNSSLVDLTKKDADFINKRIGDHFARAAVAAGRSSLSTLGFDPSKVALDVVSGPTTTGGLHLHSREGDTGPSIGVNVAHDEEIHKGSPPSTIIHESLHRGIAMLKDRNPEAAELIKKLPRTVNMDAEELLVRHLMRSKMGDPEQPTEWVDKQLIHPTQREQAIKFYEKGDHGKEYRAIVKQLEDMGAQELVKKHPQGPR